MLRTGKNGSIVVSALRARAGFGELLQRVENERRSLVIEKHGTPRAVLLSIRDYVRLAAPEPEVLRVIGEGRALPHSDWDCHHERSEGYVFGGDREKADSSRPNPGRS